MNAAHESFRFPWKSFHSDDSHGIYYCVKSLRFFFIVGGFFFFNGGSGSFFFNGE